MASHHDDTTTPGRRRASPLSAVFGPAASDQATACESGADRTVRWDRAPIIIVLDRGTFAGYLCGRAGTSGAPALSTATGLRIGSARADLQRVCPSSLQVFTGSIGTEYLASDGLRGTLSADSATATVETIGAGDICAFR